MDKIHDASTSGDPGVARRLIVIGIKIGIKDYKGLFSISTFLGPSTRSLLQGY